MTLEVPSLASRIYIAGAGYVGLVSAACYAGQGNTVYLYERDKAKRKAIQSGTVPFYEPELDNLLSEALQAGRLEIVADPKAAVASADLCFVTVGTPARKDGSNDISSVLGACQDIGRTLRRKGRYSTVVIRSTVFPGTTSGIVRKTLERASGKRVGQDFGLVAYPEFLREGTAIRDMNYPKRIVLGNHDYKSGKMVEDYLRNFHDSNPPPIIRVSCIEAEMIKYASNAFLATKVAFIDEIANLCEYFDQADIGRVADGMGYDPRIGRAFLDAGIGFGGSCLPKDIRALAIGARKKGLRLHICEAAISSNELQALRVVQLARRLLGRLYGKRAAVLGLSFKPGTDDIRASPSLRVISALLDARMNVSVYDPVAMKSASKVFGKNIRYSASVGECLKAADCCFILTEWDEFKNIPPDLLIDSMTQPVVIDGRRVLGISRLDPRITYRAVGLGRSGLALRHLVG